jgi:hypothetical protein
VPALRADSADPLLAAESAVAARVAEVAPAAVEVPTVEIKKTTDDTVCRKERPTGSLIGVTRCRSRSAAANSDNELMKRDLEEMRMRQNDQLAREAAAAMSRRRGGL